MADLKISALTASTTPLAGTEVLPIVQSGTTKQVSVANLTAGRAVSAASLSLTTTPLSVSNGGTGASSASITSFNNITGYTATGATGTTSTNLVFSASPTFTGTAAFASLSFTGQMNAAFGSVGAPSIYFSTDTTSGFYRASSGTVGVATGGVDAASFGATSASVAGGLTGGSGFQVSGFTSYRASGASASSPGDASMYFNSATGQTLQARAGSSYDWTLISPGNANYIARVPTGTLNLELAGGNLAFSTSGKGIDFSASSHAAGMTSELLADYEEGTWTPNVTAGATASGYLGWYTKIGRNVYCYGTFSTTAITASIDLNGLPFTSAAWSTGYRVSSVTANINGAGVTIGTAGAGIVEYNATSFTIPVAGTSVASASQYFALWYQAA